MTNSDFVTTMYQHVLLRLPDTGGQTYFQTRLDQGLATRAQVVEFFLNSAELQGAPTSLAGVYQATLGRQPDMSGIQFWAGVLNSGASLSQIAQQMATSPEFTQKYASLMASSEALINQIYQNALGRSADSSGLLYWQSELKKGSSLGSVITNIARSEEGRAYNDSNMKKTLLWHAIVGNEPTATNLSALPNDATALAVAIMKQPTLPQLSNAFWENSTTLYGSVDLTGNVALDLTKNTLTMNGVNQSLIQGSLPSAINADLSALNLPISTTKTTATTSTTSTITQKVTFTGDDVANRYIGSNYGDIITAGKGNDNITLGSGVDSIYFADSSTNNGMDTITQFTLGTDQLVFGSFLNKTTASVSMVSVNAVQNLQQTWASGDVLVIQGNALTATSIAALFGTGKPLVDPKSAAKSVLITADVAGDASIWYLTNQIDIAHITANEIAQVGVLTGINNLLDQNTLASLKASTQVNSLTKVNYDSVAFQESLSNNGSISNSINLTLTGDLFVGALGAAIGKVSNVPSGLIAKLIKTSDNTATLSLTGKATANSLADSISNLTVTFADKDFTSGKLALNSIVDDIQVDFIDMNIYESGGTLSLVGAVPNNTIIDLTSDKVTSATTNINVLSGTLANASTVDLSGVTNTVTTSITVNGSSSSEVFIGAPVGETFKGAGGVDGYLLGAGIDKIIFEATAVDNGIDVINGFKLGTGDDILNFSAFLNVTGKTHIATQNSNSTTATAWVNGDVLVVQGDTINTSTKIAALFGAGSVYAAPTGQAKAVVISSDLVGDATVWFVTNQSNTGITAIDSTEVAQVAVLQGINNLSLVGIAAGNLA